MTYVLKRYQRRDEAGRNVDVEIWQDEKTCKVLRIRVITYYQENGGAVRKFRSDYPNDGSPEFKSTLKKEIAELEKYMGILTLLKDETDKEPELVEEDVDGIGWLAQLFPKND